MGEITVVLSEMEARALVPSPTSLDLDEVNAKLDAAEDAVKKIRLALREQVPKVAEEQISLGS